MMKKALLSLLMGLVALPMAFGQQVVLDDTTMCSPLKWRDNQTYTKDTTAVLITDTAVYVLKYTRPTFDTTDLAGNPVQVNGECEATWNGKTWATAGSFNDTTLIVSPSASCKVTKLQVNLATTDTLDTIAACGSYTAFWGTTYTSDQDIDTTVTHGDCTYDKHLVLTVNPEYAAHSVQVNAECEYLWEGDTIRDFDEHTKTLHTVAGGCDSIVNLTVLTYSGQANHSFDIVACDTFFTYNNIATWMDTITISGSYSYDSVYGTYPTATDPGQCAHHTILNVNIVTSNTDSSSITPEVIAEAACSYTWGGMEITNDSVHYHIFSSVIGGCDSIAAIQVEQFTGHTYDTTVIEHCGSSYTWKNNAFAGLPNYNNGFSFSKDTVASVEVIDTVANCTAHYTLDLSFYTKHDTIKNRRICGFQYSLPTSSYKIRNSNGQYVTASNVPPFTESGFYEVNGNGDSMYSVSNGCATRKTLQLELKNPEQRYRSTEPIEVVACDKYTVILDDLPIASNLTSNCDSTFIVPNHVDYYTCYDSILYLSLTIKKSSRDEVTVDACDSYYWSVTDTTYTRSITKDVKYDVKNAVGCDSIISLKLTINYTPVVNILGEWVVNPGDSTILYADPNMKINNYAWYVNEETTPRAQGRNADSLILRDINGNLDVRLLSTSTAGCTSTSWIAISANVGIDAIDEFQANIYPNPTSRYLNIESAEGISEVIIYNAVGQQVIVRSVNDSHLQLDLGSLAAGNYSLRIVGRDGQQTTRKFIVNK